MNLNMFGLKLNLKNIRPGAFGCTVITLIFSALAFISAMMFQYSLWFIFNKDVPWYLDVLGAFALNAINFPVWIVCLILNAAGVNQPLFPL